MKDNTTPTPHDAAFKAIMSRPEAVRDFMDIHLPAELRALCDFSTLKLENTSFVEDELRGYYSDLIWSLRTTKGGDGYIHLLVEHQSSPDRHMGFRLMRYAVAAMQKHLEAGHKKLPLVIPVLYYAGKRSPYPYPVNWLKEFDDPELAAQLYSNDFPLVDVTVIPDEEIMKHRHIAALTWLQKHVRARDKPDDVERLAILFQSEYTDGQTLTILVNYLIQAIDKPEPEKFLQALAQRLPRYEEDLMTIAERLEKKGRQNEAEKIARMMLKDGYDESVIKKFTGFTVKELKETKEHKH
ncbi:TPA: Rpn family recombination-promoting nuclease/putative transposase [Salmonella enterica]|uniref:Rpn family recombination-promoting nuclease/putative transposase n=1 Tax=Enterobacter roggenkampii TaxID=1812935 RepID=UPI0019884663|nr:Rpn family recombination-promoting nuclease/putative transposase [Salmonella enterica subsp. enterica serovar Orion]HAK7474997.1 Rpn family recombination-promoting nuclease/putative transposase [Salmonella enterica]EJR7832911.1 Rpn family recombination-promoting nuclease/putative transposase [Salmonella enterica subsp. enterica serovar Orion]HAK8236172.1 Rpn family recombination-promoting nuclease/putative transposase [Salmonella enterica]HAK8531581.1 Rpn family recombination-promoting nucle